MEENDPESTGERLRFLPPAEHESNQSENILTSTITITTIIIIIIIISNRYKKKEKKHSREMDRNQMEPEKSCRDRYFATAWP